MNQTADHQQVINREIDTAFEIISSYVVGIFYNNLYHLAKEAFNKKEYDSVTDAYHSKVVIFVQSLTSSPTNNGTMAMSDKYLYFKKILQGMCTYHSNYTKQDVGITQYLSKLSSYVIPKDKFLSMRSIDAESIVYKVLAESIRGFSIELLKRFVVVVIDKRKKKYDEDLLRPLQDCFKQILYEQRKMIYLFFVESSISNKSEADMSKKYREIMEKFIKQEEEKTALLEKRIENHVEYEKELREQIIVRDREISDLKDQMRRILVEKDRIADEARAAEIKRGMESVPALIAPVVNYAKPEPVSKSYNDIAYPYDNTPAQDISDNEDYCSNLQYDEDDDYLKEEENLLEQMNESNDT